MECSQDSKSIGNKIIRKLFAIDLAYSFYLFSYLVGKSFAIRNLILFKWMDAKRVSMIEIDRICHIHVVSPDRRKREGGREREREKMANNQQAFEFAELSKALP